MAEPVGFTDPLRVAAVVETEVAALVVALGGSVAIGIIEAVRDAVVTGAGHRCSSSTG